jgi:hypothetical protein
MADDPGARRQRLRQPAPNYRGSTGYGDVFLRDMVGHYFRTRTDVMAGVDELIPACADPIAW